MGDEDRVKSVILTDEYDLKYREAVDRESAYEVLVAANEELERRKAEAAAEAEAEPETEPAGLNPAFLLAVLAALGGIGALVYFKFIKQKPKTKGSDNLDDYDYGEDDTEQEDEDPWETEESDEPEDADRGGDEESENPAK